MLELNTDRPIDLLSKPYLKTHVNNSLQENIYSERASEIKNADDRNPIQELILSPHSNDELSAKQNVLYETLMESMLRGAIPASHNAINSGEYHENINRSQSEVVINGDTSTQSETISFLSSFIDSAATISFGENGIGLEDAFDTVNILNHIPIVSDIYKESTSQEKTEAAASVAGGYLFAGPVGAIFSVANVISEELTGKSLLDNAISLGREFLGLSSNTPDKLEHHVTNFSSHEVQNPPVLPKFR